MQRIQLTGFFLHEHAYKISNFTCKILSIEARIRSNNDMGNPRSADRLITANEVLFAG